MCEKNIDVKYRNGHGWTLRKSNFLFIQIVKSHGGANIAREKDAVFCGRTQALPRFCYFLFAKKESNQRKVAAARGLSREFLAPAMPDAADARVESDCVGRFGDFARHSSFAESSLICC